MQAKSSHQNINRISFKWLQRTLFYSRTVSAESSSCVRQVRSARGGAGCPAAPLGSPSPPPRPAKEHPPARHPGSGRKGTCPGSSAPGPLRHHNTDRQTGDGTNSLLIIPALCRPCAADTDATQRLTVVEDTFFQQHLPQAHSLNARVDA